MRGQREKPAYEMLTKCRGILQTSEVHLINSLIISSGLPIACYKPWLQSSGPVLAIEKEEIRMKKLLEVIFMGVVFCAVATAVKADTIFTNLTSPTPISAMHGRFPTPGEYIAMPFVVPAGPGFDLTQIDIGLTHVAELPGTNGATVRLVFDDGGDLPGSFIQSWVLSNLPANGTTTLQPSQMITGITGTMLTGGARYWLIAIGASTSMTWNFADPEIVGPFAFSIDGGTNWTLVSGLGESAFDVLGTPLSRPVPEPMSITLLGLGLAALVLARRRQDLARFVSFGREARYGGR